MTKANENKTPAHPAWTHLFGLRGGEYECLYGDKWVNIQRIVKVIERNGGNIPNSVKLLKRKNETMIKTLFNKRVITPEQYTAGEKLFNLYQMAEKPDISTLVLTDTRGARDIQGDALNQLAAIDKYINAILSLEKSGYDVVRAVVIDEMDIQSAARMLRKPRLYVSQRLKDALDELHGHFMEAAKH